MMYLLCAFYVGWRFFCIFVSLVIFRQIYYNVRGLQGNTDKPKYLYHGAFTQAPHIDPIKGQ